MQDSDDTTVTLSEAILANLMVFDAVGVPREEVKQLVARDGIALVGSGVELQIPIAPMLSEEDGRKLFDAYATLLEDYDAGRVPSERIKIIRERNNFNNKVAAVRQAKSKLN